MMSEFTIEIKTDCDDDLVNVTSKLSGNDFCAGLEHCRRPTNLSAYHSPIVDAKVGPLSVGGSGQKTYWLSAEIYPHHLGTGKSTSRDSSLRKEIRSRGKSDDDCGHIIAASLRGKMVDFNLFPQNKSVNRGWKGWRKAIELAIWLWLKNPLMKKARVEFQVRFFYNDKTYPDRPDRGTFSITFKGDHRKTTNNHDQKEMPMSLYGTLKSDLMNIIENESDSVSEPNFTKVNWKQFSKVHSLSTQQFEEFIQLFLQDLKTQNPKPALKPYRPMSVLDFIPIVGSVRSLYHGVEDSANGDDTGARFNMLIGVAGLAWDALTLGLAGTVLISFGQTTAREGIKTITKTSITAGAQVLVQGALMGGAVRNAARNAAKNQ